MEESTVRRPTRLSGASEVMDELMWLQATAHQVREIGTDDGNPQERKQVVLTPEVAVRLAVEVS